MEKQSWNKDLPMGRYFNLLSKYYFGALSRRLEHLEIERYYTIILLLEQKDGDCCQQYISDFLRIDKASMVRMIDYLKKKGFIEKVVNPDDRREYLVRLTPKARKKLPDIHDAVNEVNRKATDGLSTGDLEHLYTDLDIIYKNLEKMPSNDIVIRSVIKKPKKQS